jgi:glycosyltransferase involved in cell wall biosynthesis
MRIVLIAPPWLPVPPVGYGGIELVLDGLARGLVHAGHEVLLCTTGDSTCPVERFATTEHSLGIASMRPSAELRHVIASYDAAVQWHADVVHDHTMTGPLYADRYPQVPVVTTNHGPFDAELAPVYTELARHVPTIAISHDQAASAGAIPIVGVVHHGMDVERIPVGGGHGEYALFLGRMSPVKGVETAIHIARAAGVPLRIAAKMREDAELRFFTERVRPLLSAGVEFVGEVSGDEKLQLLGDAVALVNPIAWAEPFGMVMVEALACGTPVIATPMGAACEIVEDGHTGYLRKPIAPLAAVMTQVDAIDRDACRHAAERRFGLERMVREHVQVYETVIAQAVVRGGRDAPPPALLAT